MAKTQWFEPSIKPFHKGVYQRETYGGEVVYCTWTGARWNMGARDPIAAKWNKFPSYNQDLPWRGMANPEGDRRNIGTWVNKIANDNPTWSHRKVMNEAKIAAVNAAARVFANVRFHKRPKGATANS